MAFVSGLQSLDGVRSFTEEPRRPPGREPGPRTHGHIRRGSALQGTHACRTKSDFALASRAFLGTSTRVGGASVRPTQLDPPHLAVLAAQRVDAEALAADAVARGWVSEADRHRRLIERLDVLLARAEAG